MTVLQGYKTIILDDGLYLLSFPQDKQMKLIPVLTLYMQDIYKGGLAAEPVLGFISAKVTPAGFEPCIIAVKGQCR